MVCRQARDFPLAAEDVKARVASHPIDKRHHALSFALSGVRVAAAERRLDVLLIIGRRVRKVLAVLLQALDDQHVARDHALALHRVRPVFLRQLRDKHPVEPVIADKLRHPVVSGHDDVVEKHVLVRLLRQVPDNTLFRLQTGAHKLVEHAVARTASNPRVVCLRSALDCQLRRLHVVCTHRLEERHVPAHRSETPRLGLKKPALRFVNGPHELLLLGAQVLLLFTPERARALLQRPQNVLQSDDRLVAEHLYRLRIRPLQQCRVLLQKRARLRTD